MPCDEWPVELIVRGYPLLQNRFLSLQEEGIKMVVKKIYAVNVDPVT